MTSMAKTPLASARKYDPVSMLFHWLSVLLIIVQFASAWIMEQGDQSASVMLWLHRSCGTTLCVVICLRLAWRVSIGARVELPETTPGWQKLAARANEYGLYAFALLQVTTGLADMVLRGRSFDVFMITVPALVAKNKAAHQLMHSIHEISAWCIIGLITLHVAAAAYHGLVLRDGVLQKMLPGGMTRTKDAA